MFDEPHDPLNGDVEVELPLPVEDDPVGDVDPADPLLPDGAVGANVVVFSNAQPDASVDARRSANTENVLMSGP
jgi:hypothetical protein